MTERPRLTPAIADVRRAVREGFAAAGLQAGDLVLVACSGGADSLALAAAAVLARRLAHPLNALALDLLPLARHMLADLCDQRI